MKAEEAKDVLLKFYVKQEIDRNCQVENWGELCSALACAVEALEKQIPKKPLYKNKFDDCIVYSCPACKDEKLILDGDNYCRHKRLELMRPMLAQFPHSRLFGICKAASLASPCKNNCTKIFRCIGSASSKRANFLQEKEKAELIVCLLTSILTHYCGKFAFLNRMGFESLMPTVCGQALDWRKEE